MSTVILYMSLIMTFLGGVVLSRFHSPWVLPELPVFSGFLPPAMLNCSCMNECVNGHDRY